MSFLVILPVAPIVEEFSTYDSTFWFYENGIKSIIHDLMVMDRYQTVDSDRLLPIKSTEHPYIKSAITPPYLKHNVVLDYEQAIDELDRNNCSRFDHQNDVNLIQIVVQMLEDEILKMLHQVFGNARKIELDRRYKPRWIGDDFVGKYNISH